MIRVFGDAVGGEPAALIDSFDAERDASGAVRGKIEDIATPGAPRYFFFKITQFDEGGDEDDVWTAPVWFENAQPPVAPPLSQLAGLTPAGAPPAALNLDLAIASRKSNCFHLSTECPGALTIKPENVVRGAEARRGRYPHPGCPAKATD